MENKKKGKKSAQKHTIAVAKSTTVHHHHNETVLPAAEKDENYRIDVNSPSRSAERSLSSTSSPSASKTSYVRASLALTTLQHADTEQSRYAVEDHDRLNEDRLQANETVEPYSPNNPYYDYPGVEYVDPQFLEAWEYNLRIRLKQAYPRMCYFFLCDKRFFVLVTLLTLRRLAKAEGLSGRAMGKSKRDRQFVDRIAECMSDAETRFDKDEEWVTWWKETLVMVQTGLKRGWILANNPRALSTAARHLTCAALLQNCSTIANGNSELTSWKMQNIAYAKDVMKLYRRFATIAKRLAEAEMES
ncbi:hypothetical protein FRC17_011165 [Serendipita sp. 399]|nr:hypothetical protein FRC17_011165 [Serendipita sp. 399]